MTYKSRGDQSNIEYYEELAADYELFFQDLEKNMKQEGAWLDTILRARDARTVLDASCGTGRQAIPLEELGYAVTAADPSEAMLNQAAAAAGKHHVHLELVRAGFTDLTKLSGGPYDAVVALGNGLCNLSTREAIAAALEALRSACRDTGVCLVGIKDFQAVTRERVRFHPHSVVGSPGSRRLLFEVWDFEEHHLVSTAFHLKEGTGGQSDGWRVTTAHTREYMLFPAELQELASAAGFASVQRLHHPSEAVFALYP